MTALRPGERATRQLSGVLAGGLVALALAVCAAQWLAGASGRPGPGMATVAGHVVAALVAGALQLAAERSHSRSVALVASWSVLVLTAAVLWFGWWA